MCAVIGANQTGDEGDAARRRARAAAEAQGQDHPRPPDRLATARLNEHNTSTHNPFGTGKLNFDKLMPELLNCGVPHDWWCVDLCFWPNAWDVTADSKKFLDKLRAEVRGVRTVW